VEVVVHSLAVPLVFILIKLSHILFCLQTLISAQINSKVRYLEAAATEVDPKTNTLSCVSIVCEGNSCETEEFEINYDRLVFSVGAQTTTFGTPGVEEYCNYLKQVGDAQQIKNAIVNCFESAGLPDLTEEEKIKELSFVIIGAGPTGIEFAAELLDFIEENGARFYKELLPYVRIKIVEAAPSILRPFEDGMKEEAIRKLTRKIELEGVPTLQPLEILTNKLVSEVSGNYVYFKDGEKIPYGMSLWAAGIGQLPITSHLLDTLGETEQKDAQEFARGRLAVDPWLRVIGGDGKIFALGDCSCVSSAPMLPATAQVAAQQGEFLGEFLSKDYCFDAMDDKLLPPLGMNADQSKTLADKIASFAMGDDEIAPPFQYLDLGILAYTGSGSALAQVQIAPGGGMPGATENWDPVRLQIKGKLGFGLWRSIYLLKMTSPKNAVLVALDWIKVKLFGRDISIL
jgi:NADH dehydrogenase FAD-containing subunit